MARKRTKRKKLHSMYFNAENWVSSMTVKLMGIEAAGAYINLLAHAWLTEDCHLPKDVNALRMLSGAESPEQWERVWPKLRSSFLGDSKGLYNEVQLEAWDKAMGLYRQRVEASKLGVEARQQPSGEPSGEPNGTTKQKTDNRKGVKEKREKLQGAVCVGDIREEAIEAILGSGVNRFTESVIEVVGQEDWKRSYGFFFWCAENYPYFHEDMDRMLDSRDPAVRKAKGLGDEPIRSAGWFRQRVQEWAKKGEVLLPRDPQLNAQYRARKEQ